MAKHNRGKFQPGESGNPGGRPREQKGLSNYVRQKIGDDGEKIVDALYAIAVGSPADLRKVFGASFRRGVRDRLHACSELLDRGFGRPAVFVEQVGAVPLFSIRADEIPDMTGTEPNHGSTNQ